MLGEPTGTSQQEGMPIPLYEICDDAYKNLDVVLDNILTTADKEDFIPVVRMRRDVSEEERNIWETSTQVAWALRLADSERQDSTEVNRQKRGSEVYARISQVINENPVLGTYLAFQLLSDTWETEKEVLEEHKTVKFNPISDELHDLAFKKLLEGVQRAVQTTERAPEIAMLEQVVQRAYEHLEYPPIENLLDEDHELYNTYLRVGDVILLSKLSEEVWHNEYAVAALQPAQKIMERLKDHEGFNELFVSDSSAE